MANSRKQITFDLDTKALEKYYPTKNWHNAYEVIKRHMISNDFEWLQGSVYITKEPVSQTRVSIVLKNLVKKNPWLNLCMRDCRETNIGKEHSKNHLFDKSTDVPMRNE